MVVFFIRLESWVTALDVEVEVPAVKALVEVLLKLEKLWEGKRLEREIEK